MAKVAGRTRTRLKRGDRVRVIAGKNKGAEGEIVATLPDKNRVVVKDVNVARKTRRPTQQNPRGGFDDKEMPIHASNVQLLDPKTGTPTRIGVRTEEGRKVRFSVKSGSSLSD